MKFRSITFLFLLLLLAAGAFAQEPIPKQAEQPSGSSEEASPKDDQEDQEQETEEDKEQDRSPIIPQKRGFRFANPVSIPSTLVGSDRREVVLDRTTRSLPNNFTGNYSHLFTERQRLLFETNLSPVFLGGEVSYLYMPKGWSGAFQTNVSFTTSEFSPFYNGDPDVVLPNGDDPYLQRFSTGFEYIHRFNKKFDLASGINYQNFGFSDALFGGNQFPADSTGRPLAFGASSGDLYTANLYGRFQTLDNQYTPRSGTQVRFGVTQGFDLGAQSTSFTRLSANVAQFIPAPGLNDGEHTVVLNLQAGTVLGQPPQIAGFHLGGASSVRGFDQGGMASGTSFVQGTVEYRHFLTKANLFGLVKGDLRAVGFVDYGSVLGTELDLAGIPPTLLGRPTDAFGYGLGLQLAGDNSRLYRIESGWTSTGSQNIFFVVGERF
jgi:outer membrane protein insertion porin family